MTVRSVALLGAAALAVMTAGCQKQAAAGADADTVKAAIKADEKSMNDQFKAKDNEGLAGHYADDAFFVAGGLSADGSTAIRKVFADAATDPAFNVTFASDTVDTSGDLAYARGHFSEKYTDKKTGKVMTDSGSYLTVYRKQQDGSWKVVEDFSVPDPATLKEVPPEKPATRAKMVSF